MTYAVDQNYMKAVFKAFIDTARLEARYEGHLAVFVHPDCVAFRDPRTFPWLAARRVELVRVASCAGTSGPTYCDRHPAWGGGASPRPSLMRYAHYAQYLANHEGEFDVVLWSDFRDAVFQRNPFEDWVDDSMGKDLVFFAEHPGKPITAAGHTRSWVQGCFGTELLDRIGPLDDAKPGTPALCSSNTMGTYDAITKFLAMYLAQVTAAAARDFPACVETGGIDQGHHNYIVYATLSTTADLAEIAATAPLSEPAVAGTFVITPYDRGPVYTAGRVGSHFLSDLKRDADGYVLRSDGKRAALLHQYDRCVELLPFYANLQTRLNAAEVARGGVGADAKRRQLFGGGYLHFRHSLWTGQSATWQSRAGRRRTACSAADAVGGGARSRTAAGPKSRGLLDRRFLAEELAVPGVVEEADVAREPPSAQPLPSAQIAGAVFREEARGSRHSPVSRSSRRSVAASTSAEPSRWAPRSDPESTT
ncbi:hypothetical protein JL721_8766 [Aureococcus anophagefferens]|nr:hypothetical protein JL721_8766 [Aureococcus anophagefferens]